MPSSYCGVVGFKPTYGRVSIRGVIPLAWSLDHVGPICKTVEDASLVLAAIAGYDPLDPTTVDHPVADYARRVRDENVQLPSRHSPLAVLREHRSGGGEAVEAAIDVLRGMTKSVTELQLPPTTDRIDRRRGSVRVSLEMDRGVARSIPARDSRPAHRESANAPAAGYANALHQTHQLRRQIATVFTGADLAHHSHGAAAGRSRWPRVAVSLLSVFATLRRSTSWACQRFPFRAASRLRDYRSVCRSAAHRSQSRRCWRWRTRSSGRRNGTSDSRN